jgi:hypothetical protein
MAKQKRTTYTTRRNENKMKPWNRIHSKQIDMGICPRCEGLIPSNAHHGQYIGAISRLTRGQDAHKPVEICSDCGTEEGMQEHFEGFATPIKDWPIMTSNAIIRRSEAFTILMALEKSIKEEDQDGTEEEF